MNLHSKCIIWLMKITDIPVVFVCPDSNEKYSARKIHMLNLLPRIGFKNVTMYKSSTDDYPYCLNKAFVDILKANLNDSPILVLEDDVDITKFYHEIITYPEDTDAFYLGFSKSGGSKTQNVDDGHSVISHIDLKHIRIQNMLSGHAILYISKRYKQAVIDVLQSVSGPYHTDILVSRIQSNFNIYGYYYPLFYQSSKFGNTLHVEDVTNFTFEKERTVVTAYYPLQKSKHSQLSYLEWGRFFFDSVTCPVICFCDPSIELTLKQMANQNVTFISRSFYSFDMMSESQMEVWNSFHEIDREHDIHSPELYAVWAAKQEFVREAMLISNSDIYIWCDFGCFRTPRNGSFQSVEKFLIPNKISCLSVLDEVSEGGVTIGGGVLAGDKNAWVQFSDQYLKELSKNPHGKDQVIYSRILNSSNSNIIKANDMFGDPWFHLTYLFST